MKNQTNNKLQGLAHRSMAEGIISISSKGTGYVKVLDQKDDIEIDSQNLKTALHGDTVEVILYPKNHGRLNGEVSKIINRAKIRFAGILEEENKMFFLKPDDTKMYTDILIPKEFLNGAKNGQKVFVEITSWLDAKKAPLGKVVKILGRPGDNNTEMHSIAMEKGFDSELPHKVEEEAKKIKQNGIKESGKTKNTAVKLAENQYSLNFNYTSKDKVLSFLPLCHV